MRPPENLSEEEQRIRNEYTHPAKVLRLAGDFRGAISLLFKGLDEHPNSTRIVCSLGQVYFEQGRFGNAQHYFHKAIRIDPQSGVAMHSLANTLYQTKNLKGAEKWYRRAHELNQNDLSAMKGIASITLRQGNTTGAKEQFLQVHEQYPHCMDTIIELAKISLKEKNLRELKKWTDIISSKNPNRKIARFLRAAYLYHSGEAEQAKGILEKLIEEPGPDKKFRKKVKSLYGKCKQHIENPDTPKPPVN